MNEIDPEIEQRLKAVVTQTGYPLESLLFVLNGLSNFDAQTNTHIDGAKLCWRLHDLTMRTYGSHARAQLAQWRIHTTLDFGNIVFGLIEQGLIGASETDRLEDFRNVFEFENQFKKPKRTNSNRGLQWTLSTLFMLTTLSAVMASGFSRKGFDGVLPALFSAWFAFLGLSCMLFSITSRSTGWLFLFSFGIISFAGGLFAFFTFSYW